MTKPRQKLKSVTQVYKESLTTSDCAVFLHNNILLIEFSGSLAKIPSLKNQKLPGRNFISNNAQGKLRAMTALFQHRARQQKINLSFGNQDVYLQVLIGEGSRVDEDNGFAAIKDWLEPNHGRNWGIGIIDDDKYITGEARHVRRVDSTAKKTTIIIRPYYEVREKVIEFSNYISGGLIKNE